VTLIAGWARAFSLTLVVELAVAVPLIGPPPRWLRRVAAVTLGQVLTHPSVWFLWPELGLPRATYLIVAEAWAVLGELLLYRLVFEAAPWSRLLAASAIANACSLAAGTFLLSFN
jgi:hypothetical protein